MFDLRHAPRLTTLWLTAGRPCQQPWLPLHPLCGLPEAFAPMADPAAELARHLLPNPARMAQPDTGIQRLRDFGDAMEMVYADNAAAVREALANLRARAVRADAEAVAEAQSLLGEGREADAVARLAQAADEQVCAALAAVEALGARFVRAKVQTLSVRSPGGEWSPPQPAFDAEACAGAREAKPLARDVKPEMMRRRAPGASAASPSARGVNPEMMRRRAPSASVPRLRRAISEWRTARL